jgi:hypothetical protein
MSMTRNLPTKDEYRRLAKEAGKGNVQAQEFLGRRNGTARESLKILSAAEDGEATLKLDGLRERDRAATERRRSSVQTQKAKEASFGDSDYRDLASFLASAAATPRGKLVQPNTRRRGLNDLEPGSDPSGSEYDNGSDRDSATTDIYSEDDGSEIAVRSSVVRETTEAKQTCKRI